MRRGLFVGVVALVLMAAGLIPASAVALPPYGGAMSFQIEEPADPEEYSWEVGLAAGQELQAIDEQHAAVYYTEGHVRAFTITAESAHDAVGSTVPTSLSVSNGNVITLNVHHRAGNPAANGVPFVYPVVAGQGWEGGFQTEIVTGPKDEQELREERERKAREEREAARGTVESIGNCLVPRLKGRSLKASRKLLRDAKCRIGDVRKLNAAPYKAGKVVRQSPKPSRFLPPQTAVDLTLGA
jgi:PASTA domain-containing protein